MILLLLYGCSRASQLWEISAQISTIPIRVIHLQQRKHRSPRNELWDPSLVTTLEHSRTLACARGTEVLRDVRVHWPAMPCTCSISFPCPPSCITDVSVKTTSARNCLQHRFGKEGLLHRDVWRVTVGADAAAGKAAVTLLDATVGL